VFQELLNIVENAIGKLSKDSFDKNASPCLFHVVNSVNSQAIFTSPGTSISNSTHNLWITDNCTHCSASGPKNITP
jgi:hypothetical protein